MSASSIKSGTGITRFTGDIVAAVGNASALDDNDNPRASSTVNAGTAANSATNGTGLQYREASGKFYTNTTNSVYGMRWQESSTRDTTGALVFAHVSSSANNPRLSALTTTTGMGIFLNSSSLGTEEASWICKGTGHLFDDYSLMIVDPSRSTDARQYDNGGGGRGTFDPTDVTDVGVCYSHTAAGPTIRVSSLGMVKPIVVIGGDTSVGSFQVVDDHCYNNVTLLHQEPVPNTHICYFSWVVGDGGTTATENTIAGQSFIYGARVNFTDGTEGGHFNDNALGHRVNAGASDVIEQTNCSHSSATPFHFTITGSSVADVTYTGVSVTGAGEVEVDDGMTLNSCVFTNCAEMVCNQPTLASCTFADATAAALTSTTNNTFANASGLVFNNNQTAIKIDIAGDCAIDVTGFTFSGNTYDIEYTGSGTLTVTSDVTHSGKTNATGGGTITVVSPTNTFTLNSSESGSLIQIFTTGTQTVLDSATGTQVTFDHANNTVDYVVQKAGFIPQRVTGYVLSGSPTIDVTLVADPAYQSGHGLVLATDYDYNASTRVLTLASAQQGREIYSALIEDFISESAYFNKPFPLQAIGIDRIDFTSDGTTASTIDSGDIQYWKGAGMEWEHATTGNKTHKFCSVVGTGTNASGTKGYYQHTDGSTPVALTLVSNNVNQVIQYYSDPNGDGSTADGYSRTGHLVIKLFNDGYYQAAVNVLTAYGISAIESFEYVLSLQTVSTGLGTGDRGITITVTDSTPSGTEYQTGYTFDYKIEGGDSDSPEDLLRQWIYDVFTDPTASNYASKINFNWPDPIVELGGSYSTQYGYVYGQDTTTTFHGFYVEEGSVYHPDFLRQQANDGSYFTTPVLANVSITGMPTASGANTRLQISNQTAAAASAWTPNTAYSVGAVVKRTSGIGTENTAGLFFRAVTAGTSHATTEPTWVITTKGVFGTSGSTTTDGTVTWECFAVLLYDGDPTTSAYSATYDTGKEFKSGETYRIRFAELDGATTFKDFATTAVAASTGFTVAVSATSDTVYSSNAIDGSAVTTFSADYANNRVDISVDADFTAPQFYAFFQNALTTTSGMYNFWGGVTALDAATYRINDTVVDIYFDNTIGAFVKQTGTQRIFRVSGEYPVQDPTTSTHGVQINWANQVYLQETGVSGLTGPESAQLMALGTASQVADAVWNEDVTTHTTESTTGKTLTDAKNNAALAAALSA